MLRLPAIAFVALLPTPSLGCGLALLLALDVSGSVDSAEYAIQRDGLAAALVDPVVSEALVRARAQVAVMQWTGTTRHAVTIPWTEVNDFDAVSRLSDAVASDPRVWRNFSTAIGEALSVGVTTFDAVPQCTRRIIDLSGDGVSNEGRSPDAFRSRLSAAGITLNALAIETDRSVDLTAYFFENVIWGPGAFVETAHAFDDYPRAIRAKLRRETTKQLAHGVPPPAFVITNRR